MAVPDPDGATTSRHTCPRRVPLEVRVTPVAPATCDQSWPGSSQIWPRSGQIWSGFGQIGPEFGQLRSPNVSSQTDSDSDHTHRSFLFRAEQPRMRAVALLVGGPTLNASTPLMVAFAAFCAASLHQLAGGASFAELGPDSVNIRPIVSEVSPKDRAKSGQIWPILGRVWPQSLTDLGQHMSNFGPDLGTLGQHRSHTDRPRLGIHQNRTPCAHAVDSVQHRRKLVEIGSNMVEVNSRGRRKLTRSTTTAPGSPVVNCGERVSDRHGAPKRIWLRKSRASSGMLDRSTPYIAAEGGNKRDRALRLNAGLRPLGGGQSVCATAESTATSAPHRQLSHDCSEAHRQTRR